MKTIIAAAIILVFGSMGLHAQELIAVEHLNGNSEFYSRIDTAIAHSRNGDRVYVPGTPLMNIGTLIINKRLKITGAGINPDSSMATGISNLTGNIIIVSGADSGSLEGISLNGNITFGTSHNDQHVSTYCISRCNFNELMLSFNGSDTTTSFMMVRECIIRGAVFGGYSNSIFRNNILQVQVNYFTGALFLNNAFLYDNVGTISENVRNTTFSNNIFKNSCVARSANWSNPPTCSYDNNYSNNLLNNTLTFGWSGGWGGWNCSSDPARNGIGNLSENLEYVNDTLIYQNASGNTYTFHNNYHLKINSPGKNAGTDGTDIGIYGGNPPFKDGSMPSNPHIRYKNVAGTTNTNGTLNIHFKVAAQDH